MMAHSGPAVAQKGFPFLSVGKGKFFHLPSDFDAHFFLSFVYKYKRKKREAFKGRPAKLAKNLGGEKLRN